MTERSPRVTTPAHARLRRGLVAMVGVASLALVPACRKANPTSVDGSAVASASVAPSASASARAVETEARDELDASAGRGKVTLDKPNEVSDDPKKSFVDNRVANGKAGNPEIVSLRVWHCGPSCTCPDPCIETLSEEQPEGRWLDLQDEDGSPVALADWANADVTGRFTGRTRTAKQEGGRDPIVVAELRLTSTPTVVSTSYGPEVEGVHAKVVLSGPAAQKLVPRVKDEKPWLVVAGAFPLADPAKADEGASVLFEKLDKLGIKDAERYDSRAFSGLACCFEVVLGGRFGDSKAAEARARTLAARGVKAYAKKGF